MGRCEVCGNEYDKSFEVTVAGTTLTFDSFECAIHAFAPTCGNCGCKIVGHGVEAAAASSAALTAPRRAASGA